MPAEEPGPWEDAVPARLNAKGTGEFIQGYFLKPEAASAPAPSLAAESSSAVHRAPPQGIRTPDFDLQVLPVSR